MKMLHLRQLLLTAGYAAVTLATSDCTEANAVVRKDYGSLTTPEKLNFVSAIKCVMSKPSLLNPTVPAATNRFDDYAAVHINMTTSIHFNGIFLSWHRHFVWLMEQELHGCGWPAHLGMPYWNWPRYPILEASPMFDGSATSLGSNGVYDPVPAGTYGAGLPGGTGGGCVAAGPFANHTVYFQPLSFDLVSSGSGLPDNWTAPDPGCLTRDLNDLGVVGNNQLVVDLTMALPTVADFNAGISGDVDGISLNLHGGGHYAMGGTGFDFFGSPQEPAFYLHHAMVDKVWSGWQALDPASRRYVYNGTSTIFNGDATPEVQNSTKVAFGLLGEVTAEEVQDPMSGPYYCYVYE